MNSEIASAQLPPGLTAYSTSPTFTETTVPGHLRNDHRTKPGVWALIHVVAGSVEYHVAGTTKPVTLTPGSPGVVEPDTAHHVAPSPNTEFYVEFWR